MTTMTYSSPLRTAVRSNAVFSTVAALVLIFDARPLTELMGLPNPFILPIVGLGLLPFAYLIFRKSNPGVSKAFGQFILIADLIWVAASAVVLDVVWGVRVEAIAPGGLDIDGDSFAAQQTGTSTTNGTSGVVTRTTITLTQAQADSIAAGDRFRLEIQRVAGDVGDDLVGDAQIVGISGRQ